MKKLLLLLFLSFTISSFSQTKKNYVCERFSLSYPSSYKMVAINNAPHMKLKIQDNQRMFTASYWYKGFPSDVSIWDDEIYDGYRSMPIQNGSLVSIDRSSIKIKNGIRRCLRIKSNLYGAGWQGKSVAFLMLKDGYLYIFCFYSDGKYNAKSPTKYEENFLANLTLFNDEVIKNDESFYNTVLDRVKVLNAQCPFRSDECTTYRQILLSGKTIIIKVTLDDNCLSSITDEVFDHFKDTMSNNLAKALEPWFIQYLNQQRYKITYTFYDEGDNLLKIISINANDMQIAY